MTAESDLVVEYKDEELAAINPKPTARGTYIELRPSTTNQLQQQTGQFGSGSTALTTGPTSGFSTHSQDPNHPAGEPRDTSGTAIEGQTSRAERDSTNVNLTAQERLENLWSTLKMPDEQRLDMIIKYCDDNHAHRLIEALEDWEETTKSVIQREAIIHQLEQFERHASDPNRFFERGYRGSSVARLEEAKKRSDYYQQLETLDDIVKEAIISLKLKHHDFLTYQGRNYLTKMKWDRTEMLYWLQEDRRAVIGGQTTINQF